jgi:hypothetical protein
MQIDESDEQDENAYLSIREGLHSDSNVTLESPSQQLKQNWQKSSRFRKMAEKNFNGFGPSLDQRSVCVCPAIQFQSQIEFIKLSIIVESILIGVPSHRFILPHVRLSARCRF